MTARGAHEKAREGTGFKPVPSLHESTGKEIRSPFPPIPKSYAAKVSFVPDMFRMKAPGISFSISMMAFRPVQWVGMT